MEAGEDVVGCLRREIMEEAHIKCHDIILRGTINWTGFGPNGENWLGFIFRIDTFSGTPLKRNNEGVLGWYPVAEIHELPMWEGDRYFLDMVFDANPKMFHGHMPYRNGRPVGWHYERI